MKKLFPGILAMLLCFGCLVGCGDKTPDSTPDSTPNDSTPVVPDVPAQEHDGDLKQVKEAVLVPLASYDSTSNKDYTVPNSYSFYGEEAVYDISWAVTDAEGNAVTGVTVEAGTGATDVVKISVEEDTPYVLKATVTCPDGCCTLEYTLNRTASAAPVPVAITEAPVENVAYKLYVYEGSAGKDCFITGEPKSDKYPYYWLTTSDYTASIDVYAKNVEGGFNLYHVVDGTNVYLNIVKNGNYTNSLYQTLEDNATPSVWTYDATMGTVVVDLNGTTCYLGCDGGYDTVEAQYKTGDGYYVGYLCTMKDKSEVVITDQDKVNTTLDELKVAPKYTLDKSVTLATSGTKYEEVSVSWSVEADKGATLSANILDLVVPTEKTVVKLTATVSCGEVTETKEFDLELGPKSVEITDKTDVAAILAAINNLAEGETLPGTYTLSGEITKVNTPWDDGYKNITVTIKIDDENSLECYRLKSGETTDASALKVGDTITVSGSIKNHYGKLEFDAGCTLDAVTTDSTGGEEGGTDTPTEIETLSIAQALTLAEAQVPADNYSGKYTEEKYYVTGKIVEIQNTTHGNVVISDGTDSILVYGMYIDVPDSDNDTRYDAMATKPLLGDTVKLLSVVGRYGTTKQLYNAFLIELTQATDAEKIALEKDALTVIAAVEGQKSISLVTAGQNRTDVAIAWEVTAGADIATIADGKLNITNPTAETTVTIKATLTCGESVDSKTFDIVVTPASGNKVESTVDYDLSIDTTTGAQNQETTATLDDTVTITLNNSVWNSEGKIRVYANTGFIVLNSTEEISKVVLNIGNKASTVKVSWSTDGTTWVETTDLAVTSAYADHTVVAQGSGYKYIKIQNTGSQVRIDKMSITYLTTAA